MIIKYNPCTYALKSHTGRQMLTDVALRAQPAVQANLVSIDVALVVA